MNRIIRSPFGILVGLLSLVAAVSFTIRINAPQPVPTSIAPLVVEATDLDPVILTVMNRDGGMVCNKDEYLQLRVYLSGRIEGESFDDTNSCRRERRTAMLDDVRLANLKRALEQRALLKCKDKYPQYAVYTDTYTDSVVTFGIGKEDKRIALTNPELVDPRNTTNYPKALIDLLREVEEITEHFGFK